MNIEMALIQEELEALSSVGVIEMPATFGGSGDDPGSIACGATIGHC